MSEPDLYTRINAAPGVAFNTADQAARKAAIGELSRGLESPADDEESRLIVLNGLATNSAQLFTTTEDLADLDNGIEWAEDYLEAVADDSDRVRTAANRNGYARPAVLGNLSALRTAALTYRENAETWSNELSRGVCTARTRTYRPLSITPI